MTVGQWDCQGIGIALSDPYACMIYILHLWTSMKLNQTKLR